MMITCLLVRSELLMNIYPVEILVILRLELQLEGTMVRKRTVFPINPHTGPVDPLYIEATREPSVEDLRAEHALPTKLRPIFPPLAIVVNNQNTASVGLVDLVQPVEHLGNIRFLPNVEIPHHHLEGVKDYEGRLKRADLTLHCLPFPISSEVEPFSVHAINWAARRWREHYASLTHGVELSTKISLPENSTEPTTLDILSVLLLDNEDRAWMPYRKVPKEGSP